MGIEIVVNERNVFAIQIFLFEYNINVKYYGKKKVNNVKKKSQQQICISGIRV